MKIHFCDICNESVPQGDLDQGRAFLRKGRVVCATCDQAMSPEPGADAGPGADGPSGSDASGAAATAVLGSGSLFGAAPTAPTTTTHREAAGASGGLAMVMASMGILVTAGVAVLLFERMDQGDRRANVEVGALRADLNDGMRELQAGLEATRLEALGQLSHQTTDVATLAARLDERERSDAQAAERLQTQLAKIEASLTALAGDNADVERHDRELGQIAASLGQMRADIGLLAERMLEMEEQARLAPPLPVVAGVDDTPEGAGEPEWMSIVPQLESQSSGARWDAVQRLGETADPATAPHLAPMLSDADIFVRMAAARVLGDLAALSAVPALIEALEDKEASVREAVVVSLRAITGQHFKFDPTASEGDRAKRVRAWRDWWRREGDELLGKA